MKVLAIDLGTSLAKLGFFDGGSLLRKEKGIPLEGMHALSEEFNPRRIIVSSVTLGEHEIVPLLPEEAHLTVLSHRTPIPVKLAYRTPETLGTDRIAAVVGAWKLFPGRSVLVIDTGTCITFDLLDEAGVYQGGSISPGMELRFRALNNYTARLPLLERKDVASLTGDSTENAILSGVINGTCAEISEIIRMYQAKLPDLQLVICGGDAGYFAERLDHPIKLLPDLVLTGLNSIQEYND